MDDKSYEIFIIFSMLRKLNGLNKQRVESFGLNNLESIILFHIDKIENLTQKDLVNKLQMPKQTINSIILNLKENDFLYMQASKVDKRVKTLVLTEKGAKEVKKITDSLKASNKEIYDQLGEEKINSIKDDFDQIIDVLENIMKGEDNE